MLSLIKKKYKNAKWKWYWLKTAIRKNIYTKDQKYLIARNKRKLILNYGPVNIFIEPTNLCNLKCPMCPTGAGTTKSKKGFLEITILEKVARELKHKPQTFGLWLSGEPLLHFQIVEMIEICKKFNINCTIHTNAVRLLPELSEKLINAGLYEISFSFDGRTKDEYEIMRKGADYNSIMNNIKYFLEIKKYQNLTIPRVIIQNIERYEEGKHQRLPVYDNLNNLKQHFNGLPVDEFKTILAHSWSGSLINEYVSPPHTKGIRWVCIVPYRDLTINWRGEAVTCCGDFDNANILGDIKNENLYDLWNNKNFQRFRAAMHSKEIEKYPLCQNCELIWTDPHPLDYTLRVEILRYKLRF